MGSMLKGKHLHLREQALSFKYNFHPVERQNMKMTVASPKMVLAYLYITNAIMCCD